MTEIPVVERDGRTSNPRVSRVGIVVILVVFAVIFAYATWTSIQNLIAVPGVITRNYDFYRENNLDNLIKPVPWVQLVLAVLAPIVGYAVALVAGRGRTLLWRVVAFVVCFAAASAVATSVSAYVSAKFGL